MRCSLADGRLAKEVVRALVRSTALFSRLPAIPARPRRILLLTCHYLGDTFWAMQVIPALRQHYPDAELHVGCKDFSVDLFHGLLPPARVHTVNSVLIATKPTAPHGAANWSSCARQSSTWQSI